MTHMTTLLRLSEKLVLSLSYCKTETTKTSLSVTCNYANIEQLLSQLSSFCYNSTHENGTVSSCLFFISHCKYFKLLENHKVFAISFDIESSKSVQETSLSDNPTRTSQAGRIGDFPYVGFWIKRNFS